MKKSLFYVFLFILIACKSKKTEIPVLGSTLPSFAVQLIDDSTLLNTKKIPEGSPIVFMYFMTDCKHCQEETKALVSNIQSLKNIQFYLLTPVPFEELKRFYDRYNLYNYKNIIVAKDYNLSFYRLFRPPAVPYFVIYDKSKRLNKIFSGNTKMQTILESIQG